MKPEIRTLTGALPGKTLAVFAGVHGNERAGIEALKSLEKSLILQAGVVHLVLANPRAVERNVRYVERNLNRCFNKGNLGETYEDGLARELMLLLDGCDALLDLHGYNGPEELPFLIGEVETFDLASRLNFEIISSGWSTTEPGATDSYMHSAGKIGLCAECGSNLLASKYAPLASTTIRQFLAYFGATQKVTFSAREQKHVAVERIVKKVSSDFAFAEDYQNFDSLDFGQVFARDGQIEYRAETGQCIIFPRADVRIGENVFVLGRMDERCPTAS